MEKWEIREIEAGNAFDVNLQEKEFVSFIKEEIKGFKDILPEEMVDKFIDDYITVAKIRGNVVLKLDITYNLLGFLPKAILSAVTEDK